jgi:hypothetical protein
MSSTGNLGDEDLADEDRTDATTAGLLDEQDD